ncbi:hypothetical protein Tco_1446636 [Tanacetum coccineum]
MAEHTESNPSITSNDIEIELNEKFLGELRMSMYQGTYDDDMVEHIVKVLKLEMEKYPLVKKFFCRFYPEPYYGEDEMLDEGENWGISPLEFLSNMNTSFKNHKKINRRTQKVIFRSWMNVKWNKRYVKNSISSNNNGMESQHENSSNTALDSFFKAYDVYNIKKENGQKQTMHKENDDYYVQPNKRRCKAEKFEAI